MLKFLCVRLQTRFSRLSVCHSVRERVSVRGYYYFYLERESERAREREVMQIQISACRIIFRVPPFVRSFVCVKRYNIFGRKRLTFFRRRFL